jgi:light-regulated signal transduction histidine kinase (bacteriophytochrome)
MPEAAELGLAPKTDEQSELAVYDVEGPISAAAMERLFYLFSRGEVRPRRQGLGFGLYIASKIAKAHGGTLDVTSTAGVDMFYSEDAGAALSLSDHRHDA